MQEAERLQHGTCSYYSRSRAGTQWRSILRCLLGALIRPRQQDDHLAVGFGWTDHVDAAAVLPNDPVCGRQTEIALVAFRRRIVRLEEMRPRFLIQANAVVLETQPNVLAGCCVIAVVRQVVFREIHPARTNGERSAIRETVAG